MTTRTVRLALSIALIALCGWGTSTYLQARSSTVEIANTVEIGSAAPTFSLVDTYGNKHSLAEYTGKYVVLEWLNHGCPFVKKHYNSGNMQRLQKEYAEKGVIWLSIVSSAEGKQGHFTPDEANALTTEKEATPAAVLLDADGTVGHLYGARTTPHMFVIDPQGHLIYNGAIDNRKSTDVADIEGAINYVKQALDEAMSGGEVSLKTSQPYGCSVKY